MRDPRGIGASLAACVALIAASPGEVRAGEAADLVVPGLVVHGQVEDGVASLLTEMLLSELQTRHGLRALGPSDLGALLTVEQQRQLLGCEDDRCMAELAGALDVPRVVAGSIGRLGEAWHLTLHVLDAREVRPLARVSRPLPRIEAAASILPEMVDALVAGLGGAAPPAPRADDTAAADVPIHLETFCSEASAYRTRLRDRPHDDRLMETRRRLLAAIHLAPPGREREARRRCAEQGAGDLVVALVAARRRATESREVHDARLRLAEWEAFAAGAARLFAAETTGSDLPFPVDAPALSPVPSADAYAAAYDEAAPTVERALQATTRRSRRAFDALFLPEGERHPDLNVPHRFRQLRGSVPRARKVEVCPFFVLTPEEIAEFTERLESGGEVTVCYRILGGNRETSGLVGLKRDGRLWRIHRW